MLLLSQALTQKREQHPQLRLLNKIIQSTHKELTIRTLLMLQHHQDKNCPVQEWNPDDIPILRSNELNSMEIRNNFNHRALAVVCLQDTSHMILLLNALAKYLDHMRHSQIILWMQRKPTEDFLNQISSQAEEHKFLHLLVLGHDQSEEVSIHRLCPFPSPHFERIESTSSFGKRMFNNKRLNFQGKKAFVLPNWPLSLNYRNGSLPITGIEDKQIVEFAGIYNLTLVVAEKKDSDATDPYFDIQLNPRLLSTNETAEQIESANTFGATSLIVVVPCSRSKSIANVFHKLDLQTWFFYILSVYVTFAVVESLIMVISYRISGHSYRLTSLNPFINTRAFRAILGLPFPVGPRASVSLRQLFLAMSIFGMIFSSFFNCKLNSLLTKHPLEPQVENFEQLQESDLTVIADAGLRSFIENDGNGEFYRLHLPNLMYLDTVKRGQLIISGNDSLAFTVMEPHWIILENFQKTIGRKTLCSSKNLTLFQNLPRVYIMKKESVYRWPVNRFLRTFAESGIPDHWLRISPRTIRSYLNVTIKPLLKPAFEPLSLQHFKWLGWVLGFGYGLATLVFLLELHVGNAKRKVEKRVPAPPGDQELAAV
ncbi:Hypothetical predicted protein [Drosophila guanche]|uniref:Ionotropic glutamate receptor C-terminal domain-containing protein n=2 Tax=Drosophila guanche TaxID=7266 RepID=A0A3B0K5R2_DROGU|nr:Hypothetical predicted protein [Drosophila guanche]